MRTSLTFILICACWIANGQNSATYTRLDESRIFYIEKGVGKPLVVFVSGLGDDHTSWKIVQDSLSKITRTLSYDRAGLGRSEYNRERKNLNALMVELDELIHATIDPIFQTRSLILVGHSLGCQIIREYANQFPARIAGIIFIDPAFDEEVLKSRLSESDWTMREQELTKKKKGFSPAQLAEEATLNSNCKDAKDLILPRIPIILFTATGINPKFPGSQTELNVKKEVHKAWVNSFHWIQHFEIGTSSNYIQNDSTKLIIDSINRMVLNSRQRSNN